MADNGGQGQTFTACGVQLFGRALHSAARDESKANLQEMILISLPLERKKGGKKEKEKEKEKKREKENESAGQERKDQC